MALSGAAAGAAQSLEQLVVERRLQEALAHQQAMDHLAAQLRQQELDQRATDSQADRGLRSRGLDLDERAQRDRSNQFGMEQMHRDRAVMDQETSTRALTEMAQDQTLPGPVRRLISMKQHGVSGISAEDLEDPAVLRERKAADAKAVAEAQYGTAAKYREPRANASPYEKIETVDESGNPVITYLTPDEVRAQGGIPTSPKTTAKASGPATVEAILKEIETLSTRINTGGAGPQTTMTGMMRRGAGALNLDNDVAEYESLVKGFIPMVARAVGHTGVLTQQDVDAVRALFPKPGDNQQLAQNKIARVRSLLSAMQPMASHESTPPGGAPANADPLGIRRPK